MDMHMERPDLSATRRQVDDLLARDSVVRLLGIRIDTATADAVRLSWKPSPDLVNGHGLLHGGLVFLLADTALAYLCAASGRSVVTRSAEVVFVAPGVGGAFVAEARFRNVSGRTVICDVQIVRSDGVVCAEFRGQARVIENI